MATLSVSRSEPVNQRLTSFWQKDLGTTSYTYNERNELTAIQAPGTAVQYEFSATADNGQILSRTMNGEKVAVDRTTTLHELLHSLTGLTDSDFGTAFLSEMNFSDAIKKCNY